MRHAPILAAALALVAGATCARAADASANPATVATLTAGGATLLKTSAPVFLPMRGQWFAMNQSAGRVWLVLDDGASAANDASDPSRSVFVLEAGAAAGAQGGAMGFEDVGLWVGRIRIYGAAGAQVALMRQ